MKDGAKQVSRKDILRAIDEEMRSAYQWGSQFHDKSIDVGYVSEAIKHVHRAEVLIELLEVQDCGSIGGFDLDADGLYSLEERIKLLKRTWKKPKGRRRR